MKIGIFFCNQMFECNWWTITCHFFEFVQLKQIKSTQCEFDLRACPGNEARVWTSTSCWARLTALCLSRMLTFSLSLFAGQQEFATNKCHRRRVCCLFFRNSQPAALFLMTIWQPKASAPVDIYSSSVKGFPNVQDRLLSFRFEDSFSKALGSNISEPQFLHPAPPFFTLTNKRHLKMYFKPSPLFWLNLLLLYSKYSWCYKSNIHNNQAKRKTNFESLYVKRVIWSFELLSLLNSVAPENQQVDWCQWISAPGSDKTCYAGSKLKKSLILPLMVTGSTNYYAYPSLKNKNKNQKTVKATLQKQ